MGAFLVAFAAMLWGLWPIWVRGAPGGVAVALVAYGLTGLLAAPVALLEGRGRRRPAKVWVLVGIFGLCDATNAFLYFRALAEGAVAPAVLAHYLAPVLVGLAAPRILGERRAPRTPVALALALAGTAALVFSVPGVDTAGGAAAQTGLLLGGASAIFFAGNVLFSRYLSTWFGNAELLSYHQIIGALYLLPFSWPLPPPSALVVPAAGSLVSTLAAGFLYFAGVRRIAVERTATLTYLEPLVAVLVGWLILGETPGVGAAIGGVLIVLGGALVVVP